MRKIFMYNHASLVHWMQNKDIMSIIPTNVDIDFTNKCNQDCFYCISADFRKSVPKQQHYSKYIILLDQLASWREHSPRSYGTLHSITFSGGGEPTLLKGYEKVIEHAIDLGFLTNLTTNGTMLHKLIDNVSPLKLKKINWIGVDIDAGSEKVYEKIRRSETPNMFTLVKKNIYNLTKIGVSVDLKVLANEFNTHEEHISDMFIMALNMNVRIIYFRLVIIGHHIFEITPEIIALIKKYSAKYNIQYKLNLSKNITRNYTKCHQMFQFPNFCADGNIYSCCDHKGDPEFNIGSWIDGDFRDNWLNDRHWEVYNTIDTLQCPPCRPNFNNIEIQNCINDNQSLCILNS